MSSKSQRKKRRQQKKRSQEKKPTQKQMPAPDPTPAVPTVQASNEVAQSQAITKGADGENGKDRSSRVCAWCPWWLSWIANPSRRALFIADILFAGAIAIATWMQVYYGNMQWDATNNQHTEMVAQNKSIQRQLNQAEKALELTEVDQRPWLAFREMRLELPLDTPDYLHCLAEVVNYGKTPGQILKSSIQVGYYEPSTPRGMIAAELDQLSELAITPDTIPPTGFSFVRPAVDPELTDEMRNLVKDGKREIWVSAKIEYRDFNGARHVARRYFVYSKIAESGFFGFGQEMD